MKVERVTNEKVQDFIEYCKTYRSEVDDSFLYDDDLDSFLPNEENPTYIKRNNRGKVIAAASLIMDDYAKRGRKGRFRIFHSIRNKVEIYKELLTSIKRHVKGLDKVFVFVPTVNQKLDQAIKAIDFEIERYAYLLLREDLPVPTYQLPKDFHIKPLQIGDEEKWCTVRNESFATLKGSETPITTKMVRKMMMEKDFIKNAALILYDHNRPVGVIKGSHDEYEGKPIMDIGPVAIIPEYQGKGLGRTILRMILQIAKEKGYKQTILSVNAENEHAKSLYIQEGFKQVEAVACYGYTL
ncbi:GNAT family N-acetyltransferase [Salirhabdus sp. Marseille-P4669]|uniref:GNAT family N-acetyltransferase n=1 Tax=Salirhabdus sp. Marseille-P4669 TaxID=2042310 RepID=UPI000C7D5C79|nr:GNAT family N-acetyltransferase [Salirhabdus sp. Marseille-P4669]